MLTHPAISIYKKRANDHVQDKHCFAFQKYVDDFPTARYNLYKTYSDNRPQRGKLIFII
jgi:hypothetical protein